MFSRTTYLFDLDGTLLPMDMEKFMKIYFKALTREFKDLESPDILIDKLMASTRDMINNNGRQTNKEVFMESFFERMNSADVGTIMERFDRFYREKFPRLSRKFNFDSSGTEVVEFLIEKGFKLVIATNPLFPREAITSRMEWIGLNPDQFDYITSYANMHYAKPNLNYYREILDKIDVEPESCVMVGNDKKEDMIAGELGIYTCLVEDYLINRDQAEFEPDWRGTLSELEGFLRQNL